MVLLAFVNYAKQKNNRHCERSEAIQNTPLFVASLTTGLPRALRPLAIMVLLVSANEAKQKNNRHCEQSEAIQTNKSTVRQLFCLADIIISVLMLGLIRSRDADRAHGPCGACDNIGVMMICRGP